MKRSWQRIAALKINKEGVNSNLMERKTYAKILGRLYNQLEQKIK